MGFRPKINWGTTGGASVDETLQILATGGVLADVRTSREYQAGHIPGAKLVQAQDLLANPVDALFAHNPLAIPEETKVVLVCDTGLRSASLAAQIKEKGITAQFLAGGLAAWVSSGQYLIPGPPR